MFLQHFATNAQVQKQSNVNTTALITVTEFLYRAQVNNRSAYNYYPVHSFGRLADRDYQIVIKEVIPYLAKELKQAVKDEDSQAIQVYVRALGNLGHPQILAVFEPYLEGQVQVTPFQRLAMVSFIRTFEISTKKTPFFVVVNCRSSLWINLPNPTHDWLVPYSTKFTKTLAKPTPFVALQYSN